MNKEKLIEEMIRNGSINQHILLHPQAVKIGQKNGFIYTYDKKNTMIKNPELVNSITNWMHFSINTMYMTKCFCEKVDDDFFTSAEEYSPENILAFDDIIHENMEYIMDLYPDGGYISRIESDTKSVTLLMTARTKHVENYGDAVLILVYSDEVEKCTSSYFLSYKKNKPIMPIRNLLETGFYYAAKDYIAEKRAKDEASDTLIGLISRKQLKFIVRLLSMEKTSDLDNDIFDYPHYKKHEVCFYKNSLSRNEMTNHMIVAYKGQVDDEVFHLFDEDSIKPNKIVLDDWSNYPKIDFTKKEDKFVNSYCEKMGYLDSDTHLNLLEYLKDPAYGKTMKFPCTAKILDTNDPTFEKELCKDLLVTYKLNYEKKLAEFWIIEDIGEGRFVSTMVNFANIDKYELVDSFVNIKTDLILTKFDRIPMSFDQLTADSILINWDKKQTIFAILYIFRVLICIHDRPKRTRMVKKITEHKSSSSSNKKNHNKEEKEFVISRILMPIKEAKALVDQNSADRIPGQRRESEYVLEEWPRQGHIRTYKTGRTVYIKETTVHRRLPLTEKEVHVKL